MTRRRLLLFAAAVCLFLLLSMPFVVRWAPTPAPGATLENFRRLHAGLALTEAQAILGPTWISDGGEHWWEDDDGNRVVLVTKEGLITSGGYYHIAKEQLIHLPESSNLLTKVRRWFGL